MRFEQIDRLGNLFFVGQLGVRKDDAPGVFDLIIEKFAEILHIHFALARVYHGGKAVEYGAFRGGVLHGADNIRKFANARGLDENTVGRVLDNHFAERFAKIAHQRAANAPAVHFVDDNARVL